MDEKFLWSQKRFFTTFPLLFLYWRLKLHHRVSWIGLAFIFIESHCLMLMMAFLQLVVAQQKIIRKVFFATVVCLVAYDSGSKFFSLTRMMISGEFKSLPPARRIPHASSLDCRCKVTPNSWYNWLILKESVTPFFTLTQINPTEITKIECATFSNL